MKKIILISGLILFFGNIIAQSSLEFTSNDENIRFCIVMDDQQLHNFFETNVVINNIPTGMHYIRIVFENDSVADFYKNIMCPGGVKKIFLVTERPDGLKAMKNTGRKIGKKLNIGEHDSTYSYLQDMYYIELNDRVVIDEISSELEILTDKSVSTSVLPVNKTKQ